MGSRGAGGLVHWVQKVLQFKGHRPVAVTLLNPENHRNALNQTSCTP